jgi:hypothetical protein
MSYVRAFIVNAVVGGVLVAQAIQSVSRSGAGSGELVAAMRK